MPPGFQKHACTLTIKVHLSLCLTECHSTKMYPVCN